MCTAWTKAEETIHVQILYLLSEEEDDQCHSYKRAGQHQTGLKKRWTTNIVLHNVCGLHTRQQKTSGAGGND